MAITFGAHSEDYKDPSTAERSCRWSNDDRFAGLELDVSQTTVWDKQHSDVRQLAKRIAKAVQTRQTLRVQDIEILE